MNVFGECSAGRGLIFKNMHLIIYVLSITIKKKEDFQCEI